MRDWSNLHTFEGRRQRARSWLACDGLRSPEPARPIPDAPNVCVVAQTA